jgi:nucleoid-associated protein YejK
MSHFLKTKHSFKQKGYLFFIFADNNGVEYLATIKGTDELGILKWRQTNGINHNIKNIDIINKLTNWKTQNDILIFSVGLDFVQFFFVSSLLTKTEAQNLSKEVFEFCPDVLGHDKNNLKTLSKEIKETNGIYLWWD